VRELAFFPLVAVLAVVFGGGCSSRHPAAVQVDAGPAGGGAAFQPIPPTVYVAKVKNILVGLAPSAGEVAAVQADPQALGDLIDGWMALPQYQQKMMRFFQLAFQQTQVTANDFTDQLRAYPATNPSATPWLLQNAQESFARTMVALTAQGRPFTEAMTTRQLMMTTALKEFYAFLDEWQLDNDGNITDPWRDANRAVPIVLQAAAGPVPFEQSIDPQSPNYMHWYFPDILTEEHTPECQQDPVMLAPKGRSLHYVLWGSVDGRTITNGDYCNGYPGTARAPVFTTADFNDWTMVTLRPPQPGEPTTVFYDLPKLRAASELVLTVPRVGFFSTPAFFANWQTNSSNQMRVTAQQTLIVATGAAVGLDDESQSPSTPGLDAVHAGVGTCYGCHRTLDPTRSILSSTWSWNYHHQTDPAWTAQPGLFAFRGVVKPLATVADLGDALATHPLVAGAWVQKLCLYVNSVAGAADDPEFKRLVTLFHDSNFSWPTLVKALMLSPLTTHAAPTPTADQAGGDVVVVARRDHLCAALNARLGFTDVCGLDARSVTSAPTTLAMTAMAAIPSIVSGLPSDAYGRGSVAPLLPNEPTVFFQAATRNICEMVAALVVDPADSSATSAGKHWSSAEPDRAIADFVGSLLALAPSDPRAGPATDLLKAHYTAAVQQPGITATDALRSTFAVACQSPALISVGL
jgi:hypothetical protein